MEESGSLLGQGGDAAGNEDLGRGVLGGLAVTQELGPDKKGSASSDAPQAVISLARGEEKHLKWEMKKTGGKGSGNIWGLSTSFCRECNAVSAYMYTTCGRTSLASLSSPSLRARDEAVWRCRRSGDRGRTGPIGGRGCIPGLRPLPILQRCSQLCQRLTGLVIISVPGLPHVVPDHRGISFRS